MIFIWIVCLADKSHEMPSPIFFEKLGKNNNIVNYNFS